MYTQEEILKEYKELRGEIKQKIELNKLLVTFMTTAVVIILVFALERDDVLLYLLPFLLLYQY